MKDKIIVQQVYSEKEMLMVSEDQVKFGINLKLIDSLNDKGIIQYQVDKVGKDVIVSAFIVILHDNCNVKSIKIESK